MASKSEMEACVFLTSPLGLNLSQAPPQPPTHPPPLGEKKQGTHFQSASGERLRALNSYLSSSFVTMSPPMRPEAPVTKTFCGILGGWFRRSGVVGGATTVHGVPQVICM